MSALGSVDRAATFVGWQLPLYRELLHPTERRWWRCRPEAAGVRIEFREEGETEWGGRLRAVDRPPRAGENEVVLREARLTLATADALARIAEQLAEGMEDRSRSEGEQFWQVLRETWQAESPGFDVEPLFAATAALEAPRPSELGAWMVALAATVGGDRLSLPLRWWPRPYPAAEREAAARALEAHATAIVPALLCALRHPVLAAAHAARDALLTAGPLDAGPHGEQAFALVLDWFAVRPAHRGEVPLVPSKLAAALEPRDGRIAALVHFVRGTPASSGVHGDTLVGSSSDYLAHGSGMEAAIFLAGWSHVPAAAVALRALAEERPHQTAWAVLRAAQRAPAPAWAEPLRAARRDLAALGATYAAQVDAALAACG